LPWADDVPAILQSWFGGQEMASAIVDIVTGGRSGGAPRHHVPGTPRAHSAFGNFPGENGEVRYGYEGVLMGYRWYETALPVRYLWSRALVHDVAIGAPVLSSTVFEPGSELSSRSR
jgi:beta-glucosidase